MPHPVHVFSKVIQINSLAIQLCQQSYSKTMHFTSEACQQNILHAYALFYVIHNAFSAPTLLVGQRQWQLDSE